MKIGPKREKFRTFGDFFKQKISDNMSFEVAGKLYKKYDTEQKSERFKAREFVIEVEDGQYPQLVKFQLVQDKCDVLDPYEEGEMVNVHFDLRGREWNGKYFTNLNAWRLEKKDSGGGSAPPAGNESFPDDPFPKEDKGGSSDAGDSGMDDLPF